MAILNCGPNTHTHTNVFSYPYHEVHSFDPYHTLNTTLCFYISIIVAIDQQRLCLCLSKCLRRAFLLTHSIYYISAMTYPNHLPKALNIQHPLPIFIPECCYKCYIWLMLIIIIILNPQQSHTVTMGTTSAVLNTAGFYCKLFF